MRSGIIEAKALDRSYCPLYSRAMNASRNPRKIQANFSFFAQYEFSRHLMNINPLKTIQRISSFNSVFRFSQFNCNAVMLN